MKKMNPKRDKTLANAAYAAMFPRRKKKDRKKARRQRVLEREAAALVARGIERDPKVPLA